MIIYLVRAREPNAKTLLHLLAWKNGAAAEFDLSMGSVDRLLASITTLRAAMHP